MEVGTQFRFIDNDFEHPVVTTPAERAAIVRVSQADYSGYIVGSRLVFLKLAEHLEMLNLTRPKLLAA